MPPAAPLPALPPLDEPRLSEETGPLAAPAQTAAIIAVLGVLVMAVSVGAFAALLRIR